MDEAPDISRALLHALDPVAFAIDRLGWHPDPWQIRVLSSPKKRIHCTTSRQAGKSTTTAVLSLHTAIYQPGALILIFSRAQRQSTELLIKIKELLSRMDDAPQLAKETETQLKFKSGSRIISLPGDGDTVRSFSAPAMIIEDESAFVTDSLYETILPMLATSKHGKLVLLSSPNGKRGHFYNVMMNDSPLWHKERITCYDVPRITAEYLEEMRHELGPRRFASEFEGSFAEAEDAFFSEDVIQRAFDRNPPVLELVF